jgi:hypothetical protein
MMESLEPRLLLTITPTAANIQSIEGSVSDVGNDPTGNVVVQAGSSVTVDQVRENQLTLNPNARLTIGPGAGNWSHVSLVNSLALAPGSKLDLTNNVLIIEATASTRQQIFQQVLAYLVIYDSGSGKFRDAIAFRGCFYAGRAIS